MQYAPLILTLFLIIISVIAKHHFKKKIDMNISDFGLRKSLKKDLFGNINGILKALIVLFAFTFSSKYLTGSETLDNVKNATRIMEIILGALCIGTLWLDINNLNEIIKCESEKKPKSE